MKDSTHTIQSRSRIRGPLLLALMLAASSLSAALPVPPGVAAAAPYVRDGYLPVTVAPYNADPTGKRDSTKAIQRAMDEAYLWNMVCYFPSGTYLVSDTLYAVQYGPHWELPKPWRNRVTRAMIKSSVSAHNLVGSTRDVRRPLIKLADNCPRFQNGSDQKTARPILAVLRFDKKCAVYKRKGSNLKWPPPHPGGDYRELRPHNDLGVNYNQTVIGLDLDCGRGNPGAFGIDFPAAQGCSIYDVRITVNDGFCGIIGTPGSGGGLYNVEIVGGRYGLCPRTCYPVFAGITLRDQREYAVYGAGWGAAALVGFRIEKETAPVIGLYGTHNSDQNLAMLDGAIEVRKPGGGPILQNKTGRTVYMRNVFVKTAEQTPLIAKSGRDVKRGRLTPGRWLRVAEYAYCGDDNIKYFPDNPKAGTSLVNGRSRTETIFALDPRSHAAPPGNLQSRHLYRDTPSIDDPQLVNARRQKHGRVYGDGKHDDTEALQTLINTPGVRKIFLPRGTYLLSRPLVLGPRTELFGAKCNTALRATDNWGLSRETQLVTTVNDPAASSSLSFLQLNVGRQPLQHSYLGHLNWRAGRHSVVRDIQWRAPYEADARCRSHVRIRISGAGGGRWYTLQQTEGGRNWDETGQYRELLVDGTSEPLFFYGFNVEFRGPAKKGGTSKGPGFRGSALAEFRNARNVFAFAGKQEFGPLLHLNGCRNIGVFGFFHHSILSLGSENPAHDCTDILAAVLVPHPTKWVSYTLKETWRGRTTVIGKGGGKQVAKFLRGNDIVMPVLGHGP